jgi:hypothetical protein
MAMCMTNVMNINDVLDGHVGPEADRPPAPPEVRRALVTIDHGVRDYITKARAFPLASVRLP